MKKKLLLVFLASFAFTISSFAQNRCGTPPPCPEFEQWIQQLITARQSDPSIDPQAVYLIPTIVHVINNGENVGVGSNISQTQINSQFDVLNEDFRKTNADFSTVVPSVFQSVAADAQINFCKALRDPQGNTLTEPGIHRINRNTMGWSSPPFNMTYCDNTIKPQTIWDPTKYLNIWVCSLGSSLLGYATFPAGAGVTCIPLPVETANNSGVVILYSAFGRVGNVLAPYNKGRTTTHEIGHWLGLRHIWGDNNCGTDCVADTPTQQGYNFGCPGFPSITCNNGPNGDMFVNFMDYTDDACMAMFTAGQKTRMQTCMANGTYRAPLSNSYVCSPLSAEDIYFTNNFSVYPNPSNGQVFVSCAFAENDLNVCVYNIFGARVADLGKVTQREFTLQLENLPSGLYVIEFNNGKQVYTRKVILEK